MPMDANQEAKVRKYISENMALHWIWDFDKILSTLTWDEKETKDWKIFNWLKNEDSMLLYAELAMKTEKLKVWEFVRFKLLELELSITCSNFTDFKNFLSELKHWNDSAETIDWNQSLDAVDWNHSLDAADWKVIWTAIQTAMQIADDNRYWYEKWWTGDNNGRKWFDCQGFVRHCYIQAWINVNSTWWCETMKEDFEKAGFEWISPYNVNDLQRWDILLDEDKHTELYIWDGKTVWAHWNKDFRPWDSWWNEISVMGGKYFLYTYHKKYGWNWVLRYKWNLA